MRCRSIALALALPLAAACAPRRVAPAPGARATRTIPPSRWIASTPAMRSLLRALTLADRVAARLADTALAASR
ncbi:MAG: hypothetical protein Q8S73_10365, partial [Deltaproteobacteria bacterium]|nr:hypothetical protein [Deltaproteobacteria bacterium]